MKAETAQAIFEVLTDVYGKSPWTLEQIDRDLVQDNTDYFFEYRESELVAFLAIQNLVGELEITNIAVKRAYQGQGIASKLLDQLKEHQETMFLEVRQSNQKAQGLYKKYWFKEVGRRKDYYNNPVEDAIIMQREGYDR